MPIPGGPKSSVTEPPTTPPPRTRSSSLTPVGSGRVPSGRDVDQGGGDGPVAAAPDVPTRCAPRRTRTCSTRRSSGTARPSAARWPRTPAAEEARRSGRGDVGAGTMPARYGAGVTNRAPRHRRPDVGRHGCQARCDGRTDHRRSGPAGRAGSGDEDLHGRLLAGLPCLHEVDRRQRRAPVGAVGLGARGGLERPARAASGSRLAARLGRPATPTSRCSPRSTPAWRGRRTWT